MVTRLLTFQEVDDMQETHKQQSKELREALSQKKLALDEFSDISEK